MPAVVKAPSDPFDGADDPDITEYLKLAGSEAELREMIAYLIEHRRRLKETVLQELEERSAALLDKLAQLKREELVAELSCFKDTLALHRRLLHERR